jgi:hypothetical protein
MGKLIRETYSYQVRSARDIVTIILGVKDYNLHTMGLCSGGVQTWE